MTGFEIALLLVGIFHAAFALIQVPKNTMSKIAYKILPFYFGVFEILLSLRYAGIIG